MKSKGSPLWGAFCVYTGSKLGGTISKNPFSEEQKRFTVCTPVYKDSYKYFDIFFQSLDQQQYKHFEVCVVFDGANAKGEKALLKVIKKYPHMDIKWETQEWGGAPKARNRAVAMGTGDYLTFLDPDIYVYSQTFQEWAVAFETNPNKDVIWGFYDIYLGPDKKAPVGGNIPVNAKGEPMYYALRASNYISGGNPVRRSAFIGWDETVKSLQDWDMWQRMLKEDNFEGKKFHFIAQSFFATEPPQEGGISHDSSTNWKERVKYVREKNGITIPDTVVCSLGAPYHGVKTAMMLGADYLPMPSFKPNDYKTVYLLGFYTAENPQMPITTKSHMQVFNSQKGKKIVHWIGTDVSQMHWNNSFQKLKTLKNWFKNEKIIHLTEAQHTHDEMKELGINSKIVPLPPGKLYEPLPLPEKFTIAVYDNPSQNMYKNELMKEVALSMPDIDFKFFGNPNTAGKVEGNIEHMGWVEMDDLIPKCSMNLRVTVHDGLPLTPLQFMTAGRHAICSTPLYGATKVSADRKEIVEAIRKVMTEPINPKAPPYWRKELDQEKFKKAIASL